ncbi:hypothetical protein E0485_17275 [Paenibacillus albiflavus]|uniref:Uncharacterized protein n=1 Tax=Paenibacillus albiflavus TaxID=2545760 RepID=A0A4V2WNH8_9BACL|nr:hypothetical protein [Paenibacillus albiflavus]TCZ75482.1 hypothetical protein E0485_17275 [Paenibacillus albiflavus]
MTSVEIDQNIDFHLQQALNHLNEALNQSVAVVAQNQELQKEIGQKWGSFINSFFAAVRDSGKKNRMNLFKWISLPKFL